MLTDKLVTRSRRVRRLRILVVLRIECKNEGGADKESSIPRSMSRIGSSDYPRRQRSAPSVAVVAERQAARTANRRCCRGMARESGRFEGRAGLVRFPGYWCCESGDIVAAAVVPSRRCSRGGWWRDVTTRARRLGSGFCFLASGGRLCSKCARRCARGQ